MRRTLIRVAVGVLLTGLAVSGLAAGRRWDTASHRGLTWSDDPVFFNEQVVFVIVAACFPPAVYAIARNLDPPLGAGPATARIGNYPRISRI